MTPMPSGKSLIMSTSAESFALGLMIPTTPREFAASAGLARKSSDGTTAAARPTPAALCRTERRVKAVWKSVFMRSSRCQNEKSAIKMAEEAPPDKAGPAYGAKSVIQDLLTRACHQNGGA